MSNTLRIPDSGRIGLDKIGQLSSEMVADLVSTLSSCSPTTNPLKFVTEVGNKVGTVNPYDAKIITSSLIGLYGSFSRTDIRSPTFLADLLNARDDKGEPAFSPSTRARLEENLPPLLDLSSTIGVTAKANEIVTEYEKVFLDARILTDIRPVFQSDPFDELSGAVISHSLKIEYSQGGTQKEFYVAMDTSDIEKLKNVLDRDVRKAERLKRILSDSKLRNFEDLDG